MKCRGKKLVKQWKPMHDYFIFGQEMKKTMQEYVINNSLLARK